MPRPDVEKPKYTAATFAAVAAEHVSADGYTTQFICKELDRDPMASRDSIAAKFKRYSSWTELRDADWNAAMKALETATRLNQEQES